MKKKYSNPTIRLHDVHKSDVIATSDVPIGGDESETTTEAPRRSGDWSDYNR